MYIYIPYLNYLNNSLKNNENILKISNFEEFSSFLFWCIVYSFFIFEFVFKSETFFYQVLLVFSNNEKI